MGTALSHSLVAELRVARETANVSQRAVARLLGWSPARYGRFELGRGRPPTLVELSSVAEVVGLRLTASLFLGTERLRDAGHMAVIGRLRRLLSAAWQVLEEVLLPNPGDRRAWDLGLRLASQRVGVEVETRIRDVQKLVRHIRARERDGGMDEVLIVLADTRHNRQHIYELLEALGPRFATPTRDLLRALRTGSPLPGSGLILV